MASTHVCFGLFWDGLLKPPSTCSGMFRSFLFTTHFFPDIMNLPNHCYWLACDFSECVTYQPDRPIPMVGRLCIIQLPLLVRATVIHIIHMVVGTYSECYVLLVALQIHMIDEVDNS